ncbi:MAG TPA: hypothetical protein VF032_16300 [Thermoleophilaceae bacterium]
MKRAVLAALVLLIFPATARADGPPVGQWAIGGVRSAGERYVALPSRHGTMLERLTLKGAAPVRFHFLPRLVGVPMVAIDGTPGGLSRDGRTLVLSQPRTRYPESTSRLYLVNARTLRLRRVITLRGDFSFDAISPDGRTLYLIQLSRRSFTRYAVRALDTSTGRLFPRPVVDATEPDEVMRGMPYARVTSPDGRYSYTLYAGGEKPFIHALDTVRRKAACIDLPPLSLNAQLSLRLRGRTLAVLADEAPAAFVNVPTRHVWRPAAPRPAARQPAGDGGGSGPWPLLGALGALALAAGLTAAGRKRRAGAARS